MAETKRSCLGMTLALGGVVLSGAFLSNLTFGVVEIPDNLPFVGNLDEVLASAIFFSCLSYLGINVLPMSPRGGKRLTDDRAASHRIE